jgi:hypothetical protein
MGVNSMLLQVFLDAFRFALQEWHMLIGDVEKMLNDVQRLLEFLRELLMLLIAPGIAEPSHLGMQPGEALAQITIELFEMMSKTPKFQRIDNSLRHVHLAD